MNPALSPEAQAQLDLGLPRLLEALAARARTDLGRARALKRPLQSEPDDVREALVVVAEARALIDAQKSLPLSGASDVSPLIERAGKGGVLDGRALMDVSHVIAAVARTRDALDDLADRVPRLARIGQRLASLPALARKIDAAFEPSGEVSDRASPELAASRERARGLHKQVRTRIEGLLGDVELEETLRERYFTIRNERYVVPVKAQHRAVLPGIVHNASQSGQTLFVEPQAIIGLGNELAIAQSMAAEAEHRVLSELSAALGEHAQALHASLEAVAALDEAEACARLANDLSAHAPELTRPSIPFDLKALRHPLLVLQGNRVVGSDVKLDPPARCLVISGPNAGGKTVTLTAVGLCALMLRAGLPIPAEPGSRLPIYPGVYATIGDAQDMRRDLSTFSAHVTALRDTLAQCGPGALVLIDELAADTDPREGAAIATAILEALVERGATAMCTTHLEALKALGLGDPRFTNAHVGFNPADHAPTYRLHLGSPGTSSAIDVAARVGLPEDICERAKVHLEGTAGPLAKALEALERERSALALARAEAERARDDARQASQLAQQRLRELETTTREAAVTARAKLVADLAAAQVQVSALVAELQVAPTLSKAAEVRRQLREREAEQRRAQAPAPEPTADLDVSGAPVAPGMRVRVRSLGREAQVLDVTATEATVLAGALRLRVPLGELVALEGKPKATAKLRGNTSGAVRAAQVSAAAVAGPLEQLDVRGLRAEDALRDVERFMDRVYGEGRPALVIVHGHGTGALKAMLRDYLKESPYVARFTSEGNDGATRVELRGS